MLISRTYEPAEDEIVYHYCDANAFLAICTNKKIRLSDLFSMNDFMEIHWGYYIWEKVANELYDELGKDFLDRIDKLISSSSLLGLLVATCFSRDGDVLSQWRAYADDGNGYAIGFKAKDVIQLPIRPLKVLYDEKEQINELKAIIKAVHEIEQSKEENFGPDFTQACYSIACDLAAFKNPAFKEEQEIRITHILNFEKSNEFLKLVDEGGTAFGADAEGQPVLFRMRQNIPVAFIEQDFTNQGKVNPIAEVIIGPKNDVLPTTISVFLETNSLGAVKIRKSKASYR
jgi:hypothetical protein